MTNADKFKSLFGLYATELWAMPEKDFLKWLNSEAMNCSEFPNNSDTISRQAAIREYQEVCKGIKCGECPLLIKVNTEKGSHLITDCKLEAFLHDLPSAQPEQLTDKEQRIFLAAMGREEKVCKEVDAEMTREPYEDSLVRVCHEITRKVKGALWT